MKHAVSLFAALKTIQVSRREIRRDLALQLIQFLQKQGRASKHDCIEHCVG